MRTRQTQKRAADLALIVAVVDWAADHPATDPVTDQADLDDPDLFGPTALAVAGPGAPQIEDFALYQLAATLGRTIESTSAWVGDILETRARAGPCQRLSHRASTRSVTASSLGRGRCSTTDERVR